MAWNREASQRTANSIARINWNLPQLPTATKLWHQKVGNASNFLYLPSWLKSRAVPEWPEKKKKKKNRQTVQVVWVRKKLSLYVLRALSSAEEALKGTSQRGCIQNARLSGSAIWTSCRLCHRYDRSSEERHLIWCKEMDPGKFP